MSSPSEARSPIFYGWVIVAVTFIAQFLTMGMVFYTFGVLLKPLTEALSERDKKFGDYRTSQTSDED